MEKLTSVKYNELCSKAQVVEKDGFGYKVLLLKSGEMVKIFRRKHLISSALFWPYAKRFKRNAEGLLKRGVSTVKITKLCHCPSKARHLVFYQPVPGITLREFLADQQDNTKILEQFARYLAELHQKGVYFRSIHFGNVIIQPGEKGFALIDMSDLKFSCSPLSLKQRIRNFRPFLKRKLDKSSVLHFGFERFVTIYAQQANLSPLQVESLQVKLSSIMEKLPSKA